MEPFVLAAIRKAKFQFGSVCFLTTCSVQINKTKARIHCVGKVQLSLCFSRRLSEIDLSVEQYKKYILGFQILVGDR